MILASANVDPRSNEVYVSSVKSVERASIGSLLKYCSMSDSDYIYIIDVESKKDLILLHSKIARTRRIPKDVESFIIGTDYAENSWEFSTIILFQKMKKNVTYRVSYEDALFRLKFFPVFSSEFRVFLLLSPVAVYFTVTKSNLECKVGIKTYSSLRQKVSTFREVIYYFIREAGFK